MKLARAAVGLAALGAGLMMARMVARKGSDTLAPAPEPPSPEQLIGGTEPTLSAAEAAETLIPPAQPFR